MDPVYPNIESPRVVELVDCLGDSVVRVRHLAPQEERRKSKLYLPLALLFLVIAGGCFLSAVGTASANKAALHAHVESGEPSHSFRPENISPWLSWGAGLSALVGLVCGIAFVAGRSQREDTVEGFEDGHDRPFQLIHVDEGGARVVLPKAMTVTAQIANEALDAETMCARGLAHRDALGFLRFDLDATSVVRAEQGGRVMHMRWTPKPRSKACVAGFSIDRRFSTYVGATAVGALLLLALLENVPVDESTLYGDRFASSTRFVAMSTVAMEEALPDPDEGGEDGGGDTQPAEASEAGAAGTTGIESATATEAQMQIKNRNAAPQASRKQVRATAAHSGILGVMSERQLFANLAAPADFASGDGVQDWYGGINGGPVGHQVGELSGSWGNDVTGMGQWGTVKVGNRLGRLSMSGGTCTEIGCVQGPGGTGGPGRGHRPAGPPLTIGKANSSGGLDRSIIRRHIKRQKLRIQHCYEKRLLAAPELAGTLTASFSIGGNGIVIGASANGMQDEPLQDCVAKVIASIEFPSTEGGSVVNVRYPFTFHSAGR